MIVMKFGGTSLANAERIQNVAKIVAHEKAKKPIVVVSAMSQVTNLLVDLASLAARKAPSIKLTSGVDKLRKLHHETIALLQLGPAVEEVLTEIIDTKIMQLNEILDSVSALGELTPRNSDLIVSYGERMSIHLVAAALTQQGLTATSIDASELIVTDDNFSNAQPRLDLSKKQTKLKLQPLLRNGLIPVISGYMGATSGGLVTTLGRGGSDYSATIIGYCITAKEVWIWTDVDGVMTADPRFIAGAHTISQLSYDEAAELSYFGAKVLHPKTIVPAAISGIPIFIKNTVNPSLAGTEITDRAVQHPDGAKAITVLKNLELITVQGKGMQGTYGIAAKIFGALAETKVNVLFISQASSENNISLVTDKHDGKRAILSLKIALASELRAKKLESVYQQSKLAMIAVVGEGMRNHTGIAGRIFTALGHSKINVIAIAQGSSERNISLVVNDAHAQAAIQSIHDELHLNNNHAAKWYEKT